MESNLQWQSLGSLLSPSNPFARLSLRGRTQLVSTIIPHALSRTPLLRPHFPLGQTLLHPSSPPTVMRAVSKFEKAFRPLHGFQSFRYTFLPRQWSVHAIQSAASGHP